MKVIKDKEEWAFYSWEQRWRGRKSIKTDYADHRSERDGMELPGGAVFSLPVDHVCGLEQKDSERL